MSERGDVLDARSWWRPALKRAFDVVMSIVAIILLAPLLVAVAVFVRLTLGRPVVFRQQRTGYRGAGFEILKFRTMREPSAGEVRELSDAARLTVVGAFLRRHSLDELPELLNVLRGDMSLVGPRPLLPQYDPFYTERERLRFSVRPGITGLAQINGRNELSWDERLEADVRYVERLTLGLDMRILLQTVWMVFSGKGVVVDARSRSVNLDEARRGVVVPRD